MGEKYQQNNTSDCRLSGTNKMVKNGGIWSLIFMHSLKKEPSSAKNVWTYMHSIVYICRKGIKQKTENVFSNWTEGSYFLKSVTISNQAIIQHHVA